jgi:glycosyltransferase involved in cell wall biosynthesis
MNLLFLTQTSDLGPASRYRVYQFLPALERASVNVEVSPAIASEQYDRYFNGSNADKLLCLPEIFKRRRRDIARLGQFDCVFVQKQLFPLDWPRWKLSGSFVYDFDDAVFGAATERILCGSTLVLAGNEFLAEYARRFARNVMVMPTVVDTGRFKPTARVERPFTIGWIGSRTTMKYVEMIQPAWADSSRWRVKIVSSVPPVFPCEFEPWSLGREVEQVQAMDVGLAPLADTEWERGKCGLKVLQYMACGIPVIGSPVGVQRIMIEKSGGGVLAGELNEWREKIGWLAERPEERHKMGDLGRKFVEERYSLAIWTPRWVQTLLGQ